MRPRWPELVRLATDYLQHLIRIDTTNPPGSEEAAARFLHAQLDREGITGQVYEPAFGRANLVARLDAVPEDPEAGPDPGGEPAVPSGPLLLLSHLDVVPAEPARWRFGPFSGEVAEGAIWGRGAVDGKGPLAVFAAVLAGLKRSGFPLKRDVILVAAADGETDGRLGIDWLLEHCPDQLTASAAISMGGGWPLRIDDRVYFACVNGEKGTALIRLTAHGWPGHGAYFRPYNALVLLGKALAALDGWEAPVHVTPGFQLLVEEVAAGQDGPSATRIRSLLNPLLTAETVRRLTRDQEDQETLVSMCRNSFCPTLVRGGYRADAVPESAEAVLDCRILPGQTAATACAELEARLRALVLPVGRQDGSYLQLEIISEEPPTESPPHTELTRCLELALRRHRQSAGIVPTVSGGATGGKRLRHSGTLVYGFFPLLSRAALATVHGDNERLDIASLELAVKVLWDAVVGYAGAGGAAADLAGVERSD